MTRRPSTSALAMVRRQRRELRQLMADVSQKAEQHLREMIKEGLIEGQVEEDGTIVITDAEPGEPKA
jgi:hypothetical protein